MKKSIKGKVSVTFLRNGLRIDVSTPEAKDFLVVKMDKEYLAEAMAISTAQPCTIEYTDDIVHIGQEYEEITRTLDMPNCGHNERLSIGRMVISSKCPVGFEPDFSDLDKKVDWKYNGPSTVKAVYRRWKEREKE